MHEQKQKQEKKVKQSEEAKDKSPILTAFAVFSVSCLPPTLAERQNMEMPVPALEYRSF